MQVLLYIFPTITPKDMMYYSTDLQIDLKRSKLQFSLFIMILNKCVPYSVKVISKITSRLKMTVSFKYTPIFNRNTD